MDARFVAAMWPLALSGWPDTTPLRWPRRRRTHERDAAAAVPTTAVVTPEALACWALPAIAIALHITGVPPFETVVVQPPSAPADALLADALLARADQERAAVRLALLTGDDVVLEDAVATDTSTDPSVLEAADVARRALDDAGPAQAAALLVAALSGTLPPPALRAAAAPFIGEDA
jgi:hypothetical protein